MRALQAPAGSEQTEARYADGGEGGQRRLVLVDGRAGIGRIEMLVCCPLEADLGTAMKLAGPLAARSPWFWPALNHEIERH